MILFNIRKNPERPEEKKQKKPSTQYILPATEATASANRAIEARILFQFNAPNECSIKLTPGYIFS